MGDGRKGKQREMRQAGGENVFDSENVAGKIACKQARGMEGKKSYDDDRKRFGDG